jgi:IS30 family transposase
MPGARLSKEERENIRVGLAERRSSASIARELGRSVSTVTREVARNGGRERYRAFAAHQQARRRARRPKAYKLELNRKLAACVRKGLRKRWSPEQISRKLRQEHPDDPSYWVSHETIYQSLFVQGRGGLRKELTKALRTGRAHRWPRDRLRKSYGIAHKVMISERPAEADDRAVPGHWEGDLIIGKDGKSQVGTLVERTTRFLMLVRLPKDRSAATVRTAIKNRIKFLPNELKRSLTWDQGTEMAEHSLFKIASGVQVYFCDPQSPWQRGTNENTNGLLRQYLPKGADLSTYSSNQLRKIARQLNERPRKTLGWMTPAEKFAELIATTR